jgi:hypothetical protein
MADENKTLNTKRLGYASGMKIEAGNNAFALTGSTTAEVETTLTTIVSFVGSDAHDHCLTEDGVITNGKVTVTRSAGGATDKTFNYIIAGY